MELSNININLVLSVVIGTASTWFAASVKKLVNQKVKQLEEATHSEKINKYIELAKNTIFDVVAALNQSMVNDIKAAAEDGKLTAEEKERIKQHAVATVMDSLSAHSVEVLSTVYGDLPTWIQVQIDKAVAENKK